MKTSFIKEKSAELLKFMKSGAGLLVISTIAANFINFAFNAYLGRHLDLEAFGIITMMSTFYWVNDYYISSYDFLSRGHWTGKRKLFFS